MPSLVRFWEQNIGHSGRKLRFYNSLAQCLILGTLCSLHHCTLFFFFFWKDLRDTKKFFLHSPSRNSFRTTLSHQPLLCTHIINIPVVRGGINAGSLQRVDHLRHDLYAAESALMLSHKIMALRTLLHKNWKRVTPRVHNGSNLTTAEQGKWSIVCICTHLHINGNNRGTFIFISHGDRILSSLE